MDTAFLQPGCTSWELSILQLTDAHLFAEENGVLLGVRTAESFKAVLESILNQGMPFDAVIMTGDISQDYSAESYQRFAHLISVLGAPVYFVPGNHDDGPLMYRLFSRLGVNTQRHLVCGNWQFVFLNSEVYAVPHGWVQKEELAFLKECCDRNPHLHTVVCVHHLPHLVGSRWLDTQTMHNQDEFNAFVSRLPNVRLVLTGHVHQEYDRTFGAIRYIASPSTSIQFEPLSHNFALDLQGPGWRYLTLRMDGSVQTEVFRLPRGRFIPDLGVGGY